MAKRTNADSAPPKSGTHRTPARQPDTATLRSDAAWRGDLKLAGLGWTIEDKDQQTSKLAHCHFVGSPLVAEGLALREALSFSISAGIRRLQVFSDSIQIINALTKVSTNAELHGISSDIAALALSFELFLLLGFTVVKIRMLMPFS